MIERSELKQTIGDTLERSRVAALIGERQCGKTTLARLDQPMHAKIYRVWLVIDEVQRRPDLFPILRVLADRTVLPARCLILGSTSPELLPQSSETLAGRISTLSISEFSLAELGKEVQNQLWRRGGFPPSFTAASEENSLEWQRFCQDFSG